MMNLKMKECPKVYKTVTEFYFDKNIGNSRQNSIFLRVNALFGKKIHL